MMTYYLILVITIVHLSVFFFFNDTATTEIYTLSLHDALPICEHQLRSGLGRRSLATGGLQELVQVATRSEEHTSELQSPCNLVCRLLLEKKKKKQLSAIHCVLY